MTTLISRDPFAREELHRETLPKWARGSCDWCGSKPRFAYSIQTDGGRIKPIAGSFCSIGCMRAYHE